LAGVLRRSCISDEVAAEVLDRYGEVGIIDDEAFARAWVSSRHHGRGLAKKALAGELRRKGVDDEAIGAALDQLDDDTEAETARVLVERKLRTYRGTDPTSTARRLVGMLARKGYSAGLAFRVVRQAMAERIASELADLDGELTDLAADDLERSILGALDDEADGVPA
jgi:regulatory protein